ncbi:MAG: hypothetical protein KJ000_20655 [Pirellulaceae bacterium]|nr:hypothetical protein [Pirellulaceae bacterium]
MNHYDELEETIERVAEEVLSETLNDRLAADLAQGIAHDVVELDRCGTTVKFLLIDENTGELESPRLYGQREEAEKDSNDLYRRHGRACLVATLHCDA